MALVTLHQAKVHLKETSEDRDADVQEKLRQARALVIMYLKRDDLGSPVDIDDVDPSELSVIERRVVEGAILEVLTNIDRFRGDEMADENPADELFMTKAVRGRLSMLRDPTVA